MDTENSELSFTKADTNLMREWFDAVHDLNPDYLEEKDFTLAKKLYSESELRTPNEVLEKANDSKKSSGEPLPINARVRLREWLKRQKEIAERCERDSVNPHESGINCGYRQAYGKVLEWLDENAT